MNSAADKYCIFYKRKQDTALRVCHIRTTVIDFFGIDLRPKIFGMTLTTQSIAKVVILCISLEWEKFLFYFDETFKTRITFSVLCFNL